MVTFGEIKEAIGAHPRRTAVATAVACALVGAALLAIAASKIQFKTMDVIQDGQYHIDATVMTIGDGSLLSQLGNGALIFLGGSALGVALSQLRKARAKREGAGETQPKKEQLQSRFFMALLIIGAAVAFLWMRTAECRDPFVYYDDVSIYPIYDDVGLYPLPSPPFNPYANVITGARMSRAAGGLALLGLAAGGAGLAHTGLRWLEREDA